jgi:WD40 repeat protein
LSSSADTTQARLTSADILERIQIYQDLLFACFRNDFILILRVSDSNVYIYEHLITVTYKQGEPTPIDSFNVYNKQLWISTGCIIYIFNVDNTNKENFYNLLVKRPIDDDRLVTMLGFSNYMWVGSLRGNVYVFRMDDYELHKTFAGHKDSVCCLCSMLNTHIISGSAANDTSIAIWDNVQPRTRGGITTETNSIQQTISTAASSLSNNDITDSNGFQ